MKSFYYTARDKKGAILDGTIQACDRIAVVRDIKAKGFIPLSITEKSTVASHPKKNWNFLLRFAPHMMVLFLLIVTLIFLAYRMEEYIYKPINNGQVQKGKSEYFSGKVHKKKQIPAKTTTNMIDSFAKPIVDKNALSSNTTSIMESNEKTNTFLKVQPHFSSMIERNLSMLINTPLGSMPPPIIGKFPTNENLMAILDRDIMVYDEDNAKMIQRKQNVAVAKQMLKDFMAQGGSSSDFINFFRKQLVDAHKERKAHQDYVLQLYRAGDIDAAEQYIQEKNLELKAKNIIPLHIPQSSSSQQNTQ